MIATRSKTDSTLASAADLARTMLVADVGAADVGDHLGFEPEGERAGSHHFTCTRAGYRGWRWSVTVMRAPRQKAVTIAEVVLVPGDEAIIAPDWVPYRERLQPGDLSPGDLLPVSDDDPRLVPTWSFGDDPLDDEAKAQVRRVAGDLGLGRVRTLSPEGVDLAAQRWYDGAAGPDVPLAQSAPANCWSCGFMLRINGSLAQTFGVCANGDANDDGRVVSFDHGCGAHSEVKLSKKQQPLPTPDHVFDTLTEDVVTF